MVDDPKKRDELDKEQGEEPTREVSDLDVNEDGVADPAEEAVGTDPDLGEESEQSETPTDEAKVELQPRSSGDSGMQLAKPKKSWISRLIPRSRRERQIEALQSGYTDMVDMMRSVSHHLERQSQVQDSLVQALEHFPEAVDSLKSVGKATEQQTEVLGMVKDRLETSAAHEEQVVDGMNRFNNTLTMMDETSRTTSDTIETLVNRSRESEDNLRAMLERSERRTTLLLGFLGLLMIAALGTAAYVGVSGKSIDLSRWLGGGDPAKVESHATGTHDDGGEADVATPVSTQDEAGSDKPAAADSVEESKDAVADKAEVSAAPGDAGTKDTTEAEAGSGEEPPAVEPKDEDPDDKKPKAKKKKPEKNDGKKSQDQVKSVDASAAAAATETDVTAEEVADAATEAADPVADNVDAPELEKELGKPATKESSGNSGDATDLSESADSESIIKKVVKVLAGGEDAKKATPANIEPVE